jgi:hypothetical protein
LSDASRRSLSLVIGSSPALAAAFAVVYLGAALLAMLLPLAIWMRVAAVLLVVLSGYRAFAQHVWRRSPSAIVGLLLSDDGAYTVCRKDGVRQQAKIIDRWVQPWLVMLRLRTAGRRWSESLIIPADAVMSETFRQLRVHLRQRSAGE